jgi:hypothetical protein
MRKLLLVWDGRNMGRWHSAGDSARFPRVGTGAFAARDPGKCQKMLRDVQQRRAINQA